MKLTRWMSVFAIVGMTCLAGCQPRETAKETIKPVRIGALLALTGDAANYGKSLRQGIELARNEINAAGGINGSPLEVIYEDSQADAKTGIAAFQKLADVDKVPVVIGSISSVILAVAPIADQKGVVLINSSAISPRIRAAATNFLFSFMVSGADEAEFMAKELATKHKGEKVAVLFSNNASGKDTKDVFAHTFTAAGGAIVIEEGYELGSTDFRANLAKIKNSGATIGYLIAFSSREFARILAQAKEVSLSMRWFSYSGFETSETLELAGDAAEGVIYSYPDYSANNAQLASYTETYRAKFATWPDIYTVTSYDAVTALASVVGRAGPHSIAIRDALRSTGGAGKLFGLRRFSNSQVAEIALNIKSVKNGHFVLLKE